MAYIQLWIRAEDQYKTLFRSCKPVQVLRRRLRPPRYVVCANARRALLHQAGGWSPGCWTSQWPTYATPDSSGGPVQDVVPGPCQPVQVLRRRLRPPRYVVCADAIFGRPKLSFDSTGRALLVARTSATGPPMLDRFAESCRSTATRSSSSPRLERSIRCTCAWCSRR